MGLLDFLGVNAGLAGNEGLEELSVVSALLGLWLGGLDNPGLEGVETWQLDGDLI